VRPDQHSREQAGRPDLLDRALHLLAGLLIVPGALLLLAAFAIRWEVIVWSALGLLANGLAVLWLARLHRRTVRRRRRQGDIEAF